MPLKLWRNLRGVRHLYFLEFEGYLFEKLRTHANGSVLWQCNQHKNTHKTGHNCKLKVLTNGDQPENDVLCSRPTSNVSYFLHGPTNDQLQHNHLIEEINAEKEAIRAIVAACIQKAIGEKVENRVSDVKLNVNSFLDCVLHYEHSWFDKEGRRCCLDCDWLEPESNYREPWDQIFFSFPIYCDKGRVKIDYEEKRETRPSQFNLYTQSRRARGSYD